jgi:hypothetical protein
MGISYGNNKFWTATNLAYATLRQSVAGNSTFRGIVFCNLGTATTDFKIRHQGKYCHPIYFPIWLPQRCSRGTKNGGAHKMVEQTNVLIPRYPISYLTIASSVFFLGPYPTLRFGGACGRGVGAF